MDTKRQEKVNKLIQKELGEIFLLETKQMRGILISVSTVRISPDLGTAKVYLSIFPSAQGPQLLENIKANAKDVRFTLGQRLGKQLRIIPLMSFYIDDSLDYLENIDKLLKSTTKKDEEA